MAHWPLSNRAMERWVLWWWTLAKEAMARWGGTLEGGVYLRFLELLGGVLLVGELLRDGGLGLVERLGEVSLLLLLLPRFNRMEVPPPPDPP